MSATLKAETRNNKKSTKTQLRNQGRIPGIVYGGGENNELISIDQADLLQVLRNQGKSSVIQLQLANGQPANVMIYEMQKDHFKDRLLHIDFKRVNMNEPIETSVPVTLIGEAEGVKQGGVLQFQTREIEIRCLPTHIPDSIPLYVSGLSIGESLCVSDLEIPEGVEVQHELDEVIVSVTAPRLQPVEETPEDIIQEPEVVDAKNGPGMDEAK